MFTGNAIYQRLMQVYKSTGVPVLIDGKPVIKPNVISDPDYIKPYPDPVNCNNSNPPSTQTTTTTTTSSSSSTTIAPIDCNLIVTAYGTDCSNSLFNKVQFNVGLSLQFITVEVTYNNNLVNTFENLPVVNGKAFFNLSKTITGLVSFKIYGGICVKEFVGDISCTTTTSTTSTTSSTTTSTTSTTSTTTIFGSTTTTSTTTSTSTTTLPGTTTTTSSTSTTTISICTATFDVDMTTACGDGVYGVIIEQTGGSAVNIEFGASNINNPLTVTTWQSSNFLILTGDGNNKYIFVRYGSTQQCVQLVTIANQNCTGTTSTSTTTTTTGTSTTTVIGTTTTTTTTSTTISCAGSITITNVNALDSDTLSITITTALSNLNWKVKLGGTLLAGNSQAVTTNPQVIDLTTIDFSPGVTYQLFMFGNGCVDGTGFDFVYAGVTSTTSTTSTTTASAGCSGVTDVWSLRGQAGTSLPYATEADALSASCFSGSGCFGYVSSPTNGQTFYMDRDILDSCNLVGCGATVADGWYWIYPFSNVNDVYVIHLTSNVIDDVTANPCGIP